MREKLNSLDDFPAARMPEVMAAAVDAASVGATLPELVQAMGIGTESLRFVPVASSRRAEPFEALRRRNEAFREETGTAPEIFMANLGPLSRHKPRSDFSTAFFNVAAIETRFTAGFNRTEMAAAAALSSGARAVVVCGADDDYTEAVPLLAKMIKAADDGILVVVAGFSKASADDFRVCGVDEFIHIEADALDILTRMSAHLTAP